MKWSKKSTIGGLVLERREGEKILINNGEIVIEFIQIKNKSVRLSFKAAKNVKIDRAEKMEATCE